MLASFLKYVPAAPGFGNPGQDDVVHNLLFKSIETFIGYAHGNGCFGGESSAYQLQGTDHAAQIHRFGGNLSIFRFCLEIKKEAGKLFQRGR